MLALYEKSATYMKFYKKNCEFLPIPPKLTFYKHSIFLFLTQGIEVTLFILYQ